MAEPRPSELFARAQYVANGLEYWHDEEDDIAPGSLYCEGWLLLRRILAEARDENSPAAKRFFYLLVAKKLADELGEDNYLQYEYSEYDTYCPPPERLHYEAFFGEDGYIGWNLVWDQGSSRVRGVLRRHRRTHQLFSEFGFGARYRDSCRL